MDSKKKKQKEKEPIYVAIGDRIRERREALNMSQSELANRLDKHDNHQTISCWENGNKFYLSSFDKLCDALDCDCGYLFGMYKESKLEYHDMKNYTGLTEDAARVLQDMVASDDTIALDFINKFITSYKAADQGSSSMASYIENYEKSRRILFESDLAEELAPDDYIPQVENYYEKNTQVNRNTADSSLFQISIIISNMIRDHVTSKLAGEADTIKKELADFFKRVKKE